MSKRLDSTYSGLRVYKNQIGLATGFGRYVLMVLGGLLAMLGLIALATGRSAPKPKITTGALGANVDAVSPSTGPSSAFYASRVVVWLTFVSSGLLMSSTLLPWMNNGVIYSAGFKFGEGKVVLVLAGIPAVLALVSAVAAGRLPQIVGGLVILAGVGCVVIGYYKHGELVQQVALSNTKLSMGEGTYALMILGGNLAILGLIAMASPPRKTNDIVATLPIAVPPTS